MADLPLQLFYVLLVLSSCILALSLTEDEITVSIAREVAAVTRLGIEDFISLNCLLHQARGQKHVAIELYEEGKIALAIGVLRDAVINMSGRSPSNESWHAVFSEEKSALRVILKRYEDENGFIYLEKIRDAYELPSLEGKRIVEAIPYFPKRLGRELMFRI